MAGGDTHIAQDEREKAEQSRQIRSGYRQLRKDTADNAADMNSVHSTSMLCNKISSANELLRRVDKPREQAVDSELFLEFAKIGTSMANRLAAGSHAAVTPMEFVKRLRRKYVRSDFPAELVEQEPEVMNWDALGEAVCGVFSSTPGACTMLGPLDARPKQRKTVERQKRKALGEVVNPDKLTGEDIDEEKQNTDRNMEEMWKLLHKQRPTPVLHLIMNHASFAQTVENLFSLSFLVKDQKVALTKSDELGMCAYKRRPAEQADFDSGRAENMQFVIALDRATWRELAGHVKPDECLMKHREEGRRAGKAARVA